MAGSKSHVIANMWLVGVRVMFACFVVVWSGGAKWCQLV